MLGLLVIGAFLPGCYLGHVTAGQAELLWARRPIAGVLEDPSTTDTLRQQLARVQQVRAFAREQGLSVERRYRHYAPWPGDRIVTTVVATRPGDLVPAGFWFPIVGTVPYKGFFDPERARREAERLRADGLDVCQVPVRAYSTLGWFDDPVTDPMLALPEADLVEVLLHELVHATTFVPGDADFNEGIASFIGEEGRVRFYRDLAGAEAAARERNAVGESRRVRLELLRLRDRVEALYHETSAGPVRDASRAELEAGARERIAALRLVHEDAAALAGSLRLNDACLALAATYAGDTDCYARALAATGDDLADFVSRVVAVADSADPRDALLRDVPGCETPRRE